MSRDLTTRRVFLSRSHLVSFIPLVQYYYYVWSPTQKWRRSTTLFMSHSFR